MANIGQYGKKTFVDIYCTNNNKVVKAEFIKFDKDSMIVVLPNYQKLTLKRSPTKPRFYIAQMFGMEFTCTLEDKKNG